MNLIEKELWITRILSGLRLIPTGARKVTEEFNSVMNSKVEYRKKNTS